MVCNGNERPLAIAMNDVSANAAVIPLSIDMRTLSESELALLSSFSLPSATYVLNEPRVPPIDRSIFNESSSSRRQTYARSIDQGHRHRLASSLLKSSGTLNFSSLHSDRKEIQVIVGFLKTFVSSDKRFQQIDPVASDDLNCLHSNSKCSLIGMRSKNSCSNSKDKESDSDNVLSIFPESPNRAASQTRKRKREDNSNVSKRKNSSMQRSYKWNEEGVELINVSLNGFAMDLSPIAGMEDPYDGELSKRTNGLEREEELLEFLSKLRGQWCSRRKKRKVVEASELGDMLPPGWILQLGLKRRAGRIWVYCRKYISPDGQQFTSWKEIYSLHQPVSFAPNLGGSGLLKPQLLLKGAVCRKKSDEHKDISVLGGSSLADVEIHVLFDCRKCNMKFDDKSSYLDHLLSYHQKNSGRCRLGSVADGVIIRDGKFECQFCHKVFSERHRYNGHVGVHVRNYIREIGESPRSQRRGMALPPKADAKGNMAATGSAIDEIEKEPLIASDKKDSCVIHETPSSVSDQKLSSDSSGNSPSKMPQNGESSSPVVSNPQDPDAPQGIEEMKDVPDSCRANNEESKSEIPTDEVIEPSDIPDTRWVSPFHNEDWNSLTSLPETNNDASEMEKNPSLIAPDEPDLNFCDDKSNEQEAIDGELMAGQDIAFEANESDALVRTKNGSLEESPNSMSSDDPNLAAHEPEQGNDMTMNKQEMADLEVNNSEPPCSVEPDVDFGGQNVGKDIVYINGVAASGSDGIGKLGVRGEKDSSSGGFDASTATEIMTPGGTFSVRSNIEREIDFVFADDIADACVTSETMEQPLDGCMLSLGFLEPKVSMLQLSNRTSFPKEIGDMNRGVDEGTVYDDIKMEDMELNFGYGSQQETDTVVDRQRGLAPVNYESGQQLATACVWCGLEFLHEAADIEAHSDSVGYMCPACKTKISGQLNLFGGDCS